MRPPRGRENPDTGAGARLYALAEICIAYTVVETCAGGAIEVGFDLEMAKA